MAGVGNQDKSLVLANKVFYLTHSDVLEIDKIRLTKEVKDSITADYMVKYCEMLVAKSVIKMEPYELESKSVIKMEPGELQSMRNNIDIELKKLDEAIARAEENSDESQVQNAHLAKFLFLIRISDKDKAWKQLNKTGSIMTDVGQKIDLALYTLRMGFLYGDLKLISESIDKAKTFDVGGTLESEKYLKVYEGLFYMSKGEFKEASYLFLASLSTFKACELFSLETFIFYTVLTSIISLDQDMLKVKVLRAPQILAVQEKIPYLSEFMNSLYHCRYKSFFRALVGLTTQIKLDRYLHRHYKNYTTKVRITVYSQYLKSNNCTTLKAMANAFGVTVDFINSELSRFTEAGKLPPEALNVLHQATT